MPKNSKLLPLSLGLLFFGLPFGVAVQSLCTGAASLLAVLAWKGYGRVWLSSLDRADRKSWLFMLSLILLCMFATLLNPRNPEKDVLSFFIGYLPFFCLPPLFVAFPRRDVSFWQKWQWACLIGSLLWALAAYSQLKWGWKLTGSGIEWGDRFRRAQAFYSHPLTFAYVALVLWPPALSYALHDIKNLRALLLAACVGFFIYASASRTVQFLSLLMSFWIIICSLKGRFRIGILVGSLLGVVLLLSTPNIVSQRFLSMREKISEEKESSFADDRIAFWQAHLLMIEERPWLGHGIHLGRDYRLPYYEKIGLPGMKKAYEAHNQFLQLAFEGGVLATLCFLLWAWQLHRSWSGLDPWVKLIRDQVLLVFLLGGLTQNAFFDSEVRYALSLLMVLAFIFAGRSPNLAAKAELPG